MTVPSFLTLSSQTEGLYNSFICGFCHITLPVKTFHFSPEVDTQKKDFSRATVLVRSFIRQQKMYYLKKKILQNVCEITVCITFKVPETILRTETDLVATCPISNSNPKPHLVVVNVNYNNSTQGTSRNHEHCFALDHVIYFSLV